MKPKVAVLIRENDPLSLVRYRENVTRELERQGAVLLPFRENDSIPNDCDLVWEPSIAGNSPPHRMFQECNRPIVATVHGAAPFRVRWTDFVRDPMDAARVKRLNLDALAEWEWFRNKLTTVIAVSQYGAEEIALVYDLPKEMITPIYHGVDHDTFFPDEYASKETERYFLHVSAYQPIKNLDRAFAAYATLPEHTRPKFMAIAPGYNRVHPRLAGLTVVDRALSSSELSRVYQGAFALVFPSLRESFGLPILEAMACGCPVITSFDSACAEVAGDAALLVNPRSTHAIAQAMLRLTNEPELKQQLRHRGLSRAQQFSWAETARKHLDVFRKTLQ